MRVMVLFCVLVATVAHADVTYRATVKKSQGTEHSTQTVKVWVHGDNAKVVDEADPPGTSYALVRGSEKLYFVGVERREYLNADLAALVGPMVAAMERMRQARITSPEVKLLLDEPGPEIA